MLPHAAAFRFFSFALSLFTYKLLYWSDRQISFGSVFALVLLSGSVTALMTTDMGALLESLTSGTVDAGLLVRDAVRSLVVQHDES